jgi:hypothetical protein
MSSSGARGDELGEEEGDLDTAGATAGSDSTSRRLSSTVHDALRDVEGEGWVGVGAAPEQLPEEDATAGDSGAAHWSFFTADVCSAWSCRTPASCIDSLK